MSAQGNPICRHITGPIILTGGLALALIACDNSRAPDLPQVASVPRSTLPTLIEHPIRISVDDQPDMGFFGLAVSDIGAIAYLASAKDAPFIRVIDSAVRGAPRSAGRGRAPVKWARPPGSLGTATLC